MKLFNLITLFFFCTSCLANEIDDLKTYRDVNNFLENKIDKNFKSNPLLTDTVFTAPSIGYARNKFFKVDIDKNGLTDLLVYSFRDILVVLDDGDNSYKPYYIDRARFSDYADLVSIDTATQPVQIIIQQSERTEQQFDTLVFKFSGFVEHNANPPRGFNLEKISFKTSACFGPCPIFEMVINKDRSATYKAIKYNDKSGLFKGVVPQEEFDELISLLEYIQPDKLNNKYAVGWTDDQTAFTEITHDNKLKSISDYGKIGTFGLRRLYQIFFDWRKSVEWSK